MEAAAQHNATVDGTVIDIFTNLSTHQFRGYALYECPVFKERHPVNEYL